MKTQRCSENVVIVRSVSFLYWCIQLLQYYENSDPKIRCSFICIMIIQICCYFRMPVSEKQDEFSWNILVNKWLYVINFIYSYASQYLHNEIGTNQTISAIPGYINVHNINIYCGFRFIIQFLKKIRTMDNNIFDVRFHYRIQLLFIIKWFWKVVEWQKQNAELKA